MAINLLIKENLLDGVLLSAGTLAMTALLELTSISTVRGLCQQAGGTELYVMGLRMNAINLTTGALTYAFFATFVCSPHAWGAAARVCGVLALLATQAVLYWLAHRLMHTRGFYGPSTGRVTIAQMGRQKVSPKK